MTTNSFTPSVQDTEQLNLLVIGHRIFGALGVVVSLLPLIQVIVGTLVMDGPFRGRPVPNAPGFAAPGFIGAIFVIVGLGCFVVGQAAAWANIYSAGLIKRREARNTSIIIAAVTCLAFPLGTLLGVFAIIVLQRESVIARYAEAVDEQ